MPELAPTSILDPIVGGWAKTAGMRPEELSSILGGDIIGGLAGVPLDLFLTQLGSKVASTGLGLAGLLLGTYTLTGKGRLQTDAMQISSRLLTEILDPSPQQIKEIQRNIGDLVDGLIQGRWDKVAYAIIRNPRELTRMIPGGTPKKKSSSPPQGTPPPQSKSPPKTSGIVMKL